MTILSTSTHRLTCNSGHLLVLCKHDGDSGVVMMSVMVNYYEYEYDEFRAVIHITGDIFPVEVRPEGIYFRPKVKHCHSVLNRYISKCMYDLLVTFYLEVIYNSITAEYVLWINYLAPALSPLISYPDVSTVAGADFDAGADHILT